MQTDSLLTKHARKLIAWWADNSETSDSGSIARELSRLEQENQRLQARVDSLDCAHKLALGEVERLRDELDAEKIASTYWQDQYNIRNDVAISVGDQLAAARAEVQRLRENAEMDKAQRAEWQETIDKLEAENASIRNQLRLALIISEPKQVDSVMERISLLGTTVDSILSTVEKLAERPHDHGPVPMLTGINLTINGILERIEKLEGDAGRIALLEGRIQGIAEAAKERLDSHDLRLRTLEADARSARENFFHGIDPQNKQPVPTARNPFEDLRPPRGL